jgi:uncharacterized integral membrane protein
MILIGLLLMAACAAVAVDAVVQNTHAVHAVVFGQSLSHLSVGVLFVAGAIAGLLFALGLRMVGAGVGRAGRKRRERKAAARDAQAETAALREHNERLQAQLEAERGGSTAAYPDEPDRDGALQHANADGSSGRHRG